MASHEGARAEGPQRNSTPPEPELPPVSGGGGGGAPKPSQGGTVVPPSVAEIRGAGPVGAVQKLRGAIARLLEQVEERQREGAGEERGLRKRSQVHAGIAGLRREPGQHGDVQAQPHPRPCLFLIAPSES